MRHGIAGNKLNRHGSWRKATVRDIAKATLKHERIQTTKMKAKEARKLVDKLITLGKKGSLAHKRRAFAILCDHKLVSELFNIIAPRFTNRNGGYTRIISLWKRRGDNADMALLELTERSEKQEAAQKAAAEATVVEDAEIVEEQPKEEKKSKKKTTKKAAKKAAASA